MDAAQSSCALGIGRVLDVPGPLENSFPPSRRGKNTKCQLLRFVIPDSLTKILFALGWMNDAEGTLDPVEKI